MLQSPSAVTDFTLSPFSNDGLGGGDPAFRPE